MRRDSPRGQRSNIKLTYTTPCSDHVCFRAAPVKQEPSPAPATENCTQTQAFRARIVFVQLR
jgi:hypothetical protein